MKRKIPEVLTTEEQQAFLKTFNRKAPTGLRNYAMMKIMLDAGLRCGEVLNLRSKDIDWNTGKIHIHQGKGKKDRILWLNDDALEVLKQWKVIKPESDLLFTTLKGEKINSRYIRALVERKAKQAGIEKDIHPHTLRHTFATDIYRESKNLRLVQKALVHSSIKITEIYTHIIDKELERCLKYFRKIS